MSKHDSQFYGLAFDCSTFSGAFCSGGYVVKNCRCTVVEARMERRLPVSYVPPGSQRTKRTESLTLAKLAERVREIPNIVLRAVK